MQSEELAHHGIHGMKWGVRRFQNKDGSLTAAGKKRYGIGGGEADSSGKGGKPPAGKSGGKKVSEMNDEELSQVLKRLRMERDIAQIQAELKKYELGEQNGQGNNNQNEQNKKQKKNNQEKAESFVKSQSKKFIQTIVAGRLEKLANKIANGDKKESEADKQTKKKNQNSEIKIDPKKNPGEYSNAELNAILNRAKKDMEYQNVVRNQWAPNQESYRSAAANKQDAENWLNTLFDRERVVLFESKQERKERKKKYGSIKD